MAATDIPGERGARVSLDGAVAVVTGATAGIGAATARALHDRGARVVLAARRADRLEELAAEIDGLAVQCDVGDWDQVQALVARAVEWGGRIDVMVNNAGMGSFGRLHEADPAAAAAMVRVNIMGVIHGIRAAGARMAKQGSGGIVNVSSIVGRVPRPGRWGVRGDQGRRRPADAHGLPRAPRRGRARRPREAGPHRHRVLVGRPRNGAPDGRRPAREGGALDLRRARVGLGQRRIPLKPRAAPTLRSWPLSAHPPSSSSLPTPRPTG